MPNTFHVAAEPVAGDADLPSPFDPRLTKMDHIEKLVMAWADLSAENFVRATNAMTLEEVRIGITQCQKVATELVARARAVADLEERLRAAAQEAAYYRTAEDSAEDMRRVAG